MRNVPHWDVPVTNSPFTFWRDFSLAREGSIPGPVLFSLQQAQLPSGPTCRAPCPLRLVYRQRSVSREPSFIQQILLRPRCVPGAALGAVDTAVDKQRGPGPRGPTRWWWRHR